MAKRSTTEWADILGPAREFEAAVTKTRSLYDLPLVADGAKEIALLSIFKEEQRFAFQPVMRSLQRLSELTDWSHSFFVCDRVETEFFDWRKMPLRQYASFQDFYHRELEATWGKWESLQHTYAKIVRGEITKGDAREIEREIEKRARHAHEINDRDQANKAASKPGRRTDLERERAADQAQRTDLFDSNFVSIKKNDTHEVKRPSTGSAARAMRKLREDAPAIHARVLNGEMTANAGMIEAGFRKKAASRKTPMVARLLKLWETATDIERAEFLAKIDQ